MQGTRGGLSLLAPDTIECKNASVCPNCDVRGGVLCLRNGFRDSDDKHRLACLDERAATNSPVARSESQKGNQTTIPGVSSNFDLVNRSCSSGDAFCWDCDAHTKSEMRLYRLD